MMLAVTHEGAVLHSDHTASLKWSVVRRTENKLTHPVHLFLSSGREMHSISVHILILYSDLIAFHFVASVVSSSEHFNFCFVDFSKK